MKIRSLICIIALSSMLGCTNGSKQACVYFYDESDTFIQSFSRSLTSSFEDVNIPLNISYSNKSQNTQNNQIISDLEKSNNDVFLVNLVDRFAAKTIIDKINSKGKKVLFFNREPLEEDLLSFKDCYYVGTDPSYEGKLQTEMAISLFGDNPTSLNTKYDKNGDNKIQLVMLKGELGHQDAEKRTDSVLNSFLELGYEIELLTSVYCNWSKETAYNEIKSIYNQFNNKIELLISNNDDMALGAIQYFLEEKIFKNNSTFDQQPFPILGVDATEVGLDAINNGLMYGTVKNDATTQAKVLATITQYFIENKKVNSSFPYTINDNNTIYIKGEKVVFQKEM